MTPGTGLCRVVPPAALLLACGCVVEPHNVQGPAFSPDGSVAAYVRRSTYYGSGPSRQPVAICWRQVADPDVEHRATSVAETIGTSHGGRLDLVLRFSPDSWHLAVLTPGRLEVLEIAQAKLLPVGPPEQLITSVAWLEGQRLAYAAHGSRTGRRPIYSNRGIYIEPLGRPAERRLVWSEQKVAAGLELFEWPLEQWSPDGRWLVFQSPYEAGEFKALDVQAGQARSVAPCDGYTSQVAWRPDSSAFACFADRPVRAWAIEVDSGRVHEFTEPLREAIGNDPPQVAPLWSAEGRYVLVNSRTTPGRLIQPEPWECIALRSRLEPQFKVDRPERRWPYWTIYPLPVRAWVAFWAPGANLWACDYHGGHSFELSEDAWHGWAMSPDGSHLVQVTSLAGSVGKAPIARVEWPDQSSQPADGVRE